MRAFHEGGQVNIEVTDDGAGVDVERVKRKALERGLITPQKAAHMSEREALELLFLPGLLDRPEGYEGFRPRRRHGRG